MQCRVILTLSFYAIVHFKGTIQKTSKSSSIRKLEIKASSSPLSHTDVIIVGEYSILKLSWKLTSLFDLVEKWIC